MTLTILGVAIAAPAQAAGSNEISRMDVVANAAQDGAITVTQTIDMVFNESGSHGPYLYYVTRQDIAGDSKHVRVIDYTIQSVTSPTGAPATYQTEQSDGLLKLRIGSANQTVSGTQTYVVQYVVRGIVNPAVASSNMDEIYWNLIGVDGLAMTVSNVSVTLTGPAAVSDTRCWTGRDFTTPCDAHAASGDTATFTQQRLASGEPLAIVGGWPIGTFVGAEPILEIKNPGSLAFAPAVAGIGAAAALTLGAIALVVRVSRRGRDQVYAGLTPGLAPSPGQEHQVERVASVPFAVQFTPPKGLAPGMVGTLVDERADVKDVSATLVDMAVHGHLRFVETGKKSTTFERISNGENLLPYEKMLFDGVFESGDRVTLKDLKAKNFGTTMQSVQSELMTAVVKMGWYTTNPTFTKVKYVMLGIAVAVVGGMGAYFGALMLGAAGISGFGWLIAPFIVAGLGLMAIAGRMPARTPEGSAALAQTLGFRQYLETAEADQLKWEEGEDIFSRYLPFAIVFGCADRWASLFRQLAESGVNVPIPSWYVGGMYYSAANFGGQVDSILSSLDGFNASAASAMTAATAGSGGGSGFSGGGFGGGVGGGGGGSW